MIDVESSSMLMLSHPGFPETPLFFQGQADAIAGTHILRGRFDFPRFEGEPRPRYLLDLAAGSGAFAAWAYTKWPYLWCDCVESSIAKRQLIVLNGPPGTRIFESFEGVMHGRMGDRICPDVLHLRLDGAEHEAIEQLPIEWLAVKVVVVEVVDTTTFVMAAVAFEALGFDLKAADAFSQTWVRT